MPARARHPMPEIVRDALAQGGLRDLFDARPAYQRNDYIGWIGRAKSDATRDKRLKQMIDELQRGGIYMGMAHKPSARANAGDRRAESRA